jgi:hypothetical protein
MTNALVPASQQAPLPMQALTVEKIHPDNITREQAIMRAMGLDNREWKALQKRRKRLAAALGKTNFVVLMKAYETAQTQLEQNAAEYYRLKQDRPDGWQESILTLRDKNLRDKSHVAHIAFQLKPLIFQAKLLKKIDSTIAVFEIARERKKIHQQKYKEITDEAMHYLAMIRSVWKTFSVCHHIRTREGKRIIEIPEIDRIVITDNVIYFKILTSEKTLFGYRFTLPYNVYIQALLSDEILRNIESATGREIKASFPDKGKEDVHGYWYELNRTDTPNGILKEVAYREVMRHYPDDYKARVVIPVGVGEGNKIKFVNFNDYPHWLLAGSTGTGKSNLINVIFCALISKYIPAELRIVAVDLKGGVELSIYENIPHLLGDVVQSVEPLADRLSQLEAEMAHRFALLKSRGARDLYTFNQRSLHNNRDTLPRIVVIIDEFASTVDQGDITRRIHNSILQLSSKGRAVGINIIVCTQDPRVDIVPGKIKANCVIRIAGRTASTENSRAIIGSGEAAKIANVRGRMLLKIEQLPVEIQTALILDADVELVIKAAMEGGDAPLLQLPEATSADHRYTQERIIELSLTHLDGLISARPVWDEVKESGMTLSEVRAIVEAIWIKGVIIFNGVTYKVEKRRQSRYLVAVEENEPA